jgi:outer membrane protein assembly factor BamB
MLGADGSVALAFENTGRLMVLEATGEMRWSKSIGGSIVGGQLARGPDGGVFFADFVSVQSFGPDGTELWEKKFPFEIPPAHAARRHIANKNSVMFSLAELAVGPRGDLYCHAMDGLLYVLDKDGTYRWSFPKGAYGTGGGGMVFTDRGAVVICSSRLMSAPLPGGGTIALAETDRMIVCLSPDGELLWEAPLSGHVRWQLPSTKADWGYAWRTRFGINGFSPGRNFKLAPDGSVAFSRYFQYSSRGFSIYFIPPSIFHRTDADVHE